MNDQSLAKNLDELRARYPYQFAGENIGLCVPKGWIPAFAKLCADIDQVLGKDQFGFHWTQLKEKFGSGRFYYGFKGRKSDLHLDLIGPEGVASGVLHLKRKERTDSDKVFTRISAEVFRLTEEAARQTRHTCLVCGSHGEIDLEGGYALVLCPGHKASRESKDGWPNDIWDMLEEDRRRLEAMKTETEMLRRRRREEPK